MPEYLSPGVYVEEIDTGAKPIEGVSTSTAGMVGITERGPVNVPILLTNNGDYARWFGGLLDPELFGANAYLPHAVDGFFTNGGRRLYVTRVQAPAANPAEVDLHDRGEGIAPAIPVSSVLLHAAATGSGVAGSELLVLDAGGIAAGERIRVGDGSNAEWHDVAAGSPAAAPGLEMLSFPLTRSYAVAANLIRNFNDVPDAAFPGGLAGSLQAAASPGDIVLMVTSVNDLTTLNPNVATRAIELRQTGPRELGRFTSVQHLTGNLYRLNLSRPLGAAHPAGSDVFVLVADPAAPAGTDTPTAALAAGDQLLPIAAPAAPGTIIEVVAPSGPTEMRRVSDPGRIPLQDAAGWSYPRGSVIEHLNLTATGTAPRLLADAPIGGLSISVNNRTGLATGGVLQFGAGVQAEYVTIAALPGSGGSAVTGPGPVTLVHGLRRAWPSGLVLVLQTAPVTTAARSGLLLQDVDPSATVLISSETDGFNVANGVRITTPDGIPYLALIDFASVAAGAPRTVQLTAALLRNQPAGATMIRRTELLQVQAIDTGDWGNRLLVSVQDETTGLVARANAVGTIAANRVQLSTLAGVEPGSVLELLQPDGSRIGGLLKVTALHRNDGSATLSANLDANQLAAVTAPGARVPVRSREFRLTVLLRQRDDPAVPTRSEQIMDTEVFRNLSMDPRHSRYVETVIGQIGGPPRLSDRRPEGESNYIRVFDVLTPVVPVPNDPRFAIRLGPEPLVDRLTSGTLRAARAPLLGGDDGLGTLNDGVFVGMDDREPVNRTGIYSLKNVDDISIVACPGQVSSTIQQSLITHCEDFRYRFAVLDGPAPVDDAIADIQAFRQRYDTKYAAIYYPWLTIPDPTPGNLAAIAQFPIPPAGHVMGVYARIDNDRGVHKAPANEVVRGITGLRRYLNKAENDILNPYPSNINVIRDFRVDSRAIRIWGARVITSDPDFKYVPVRRLMIFIEKSIDRGLQWVVFEPNAEPLWARVRFAIESFLLTVWRNGALEGTKPDQAYFVICDRTTMTQADIDNGRLICVVGVAPVKPAEFVIIRIGLMTAVSDN
jgi:phage tail sheath protein FI